MNWRVRTGLLATRNFFLLAGVAALAMAAVIWLPGIFPATEGLQDGQKSQEMGRNRTAVLAFLGGLIALVGAFYTARTFRLSHRGQMTERFFRAAAPLVDDKRGPVLAAIYDLESIARESPIDREAVLNVLRDYVRTNDTPAATVEAAERVIQRLVPPSSPSILSSVLRNLRQLLSSYWAVWERVVLENKSTDGALRATLRSLGSVMSASVLVVAQALRVGLVDGVAAVISALLGLNRLAPQPIIVHENEPPELSAALDARDQAMDEVLGARDRVTGARLNGEEQGIVHALDAQSLAIQRLADADRGVDAARARANARGTP